MNSKLVACLFASVLVAGLCAGAAMLAGWGLLPGFAIYSLTGSLSLVLFAVLACQDATFEPVDSALTAHNG